MKRLRFHSVWIQSALAVAAFVAVIVASFTLIARQGRTPEESAFPPQAAVTFIHDMQTAIFNENWNRADSILEANAGSVNMEPYYHLMRASRLQAQMFATEERGAEDEMRMSLGIAQDIFQKQLQHASKPDSARLYYFIGACQTHRALWEAKNGSIFRAISEGYDARDSYTAGIACDETFAENRIGLGAYKYWKSAKSGGVLRTLQIIDDERDEGMQMVESAIPYASLAPDAGKSALVWILINEEKYGQAAKMAKQLHDRYPDGLTFLWPMAEALKKDYKYRDALDAYLQIHDRLVKEPGNQLNLIRADYEVTVLARVLEDQVTLARIGKDFSEYSQATPRDTREKLEFEYRALRRL